MAVAGQPRKLFFLRGSRLPIEFSKGFDWSLMKVKATDAEHPYIACANEQLAHLLLKGQGIERECSVVAASDLDDRHYYDFSASPILLFESEREVNSYLAAPGDYSFHQHMFRYDPATGAVQRAI